MKRIYISTEKRIIELWFKGLPRDTIAQQVGVSGSTVSEVVNRFPKELEDLRRLSRELRKFGLSVSEAQKGAKLCFKLEEWGVRFNGLQGSIQAMQKIGQSSSYEPQHLITSATRLSHLEEKAGGSYFEIIEDFEDKIESVEKLKKRERKLMQNVKELDTKRKTKLAENQVTVREIAYTVNLRKNLRRHGLKLSDVEGLHKYLENMRETGGNPKKFVEYTRKNGSIKRRITFLKKKEQEQILLLQSLQEKKQIVINDVDNHLSILNGLKTDICEMQKNFRDLIKKIRETREKDQEVLTRMAILLQTEAKIEKIIEALAVRETKLHQQDIKISENQAKLKTLQTNNQELENRNATIEQEIKDKLKINNCVTELRTAIATLEKESFEKRDRLALADTITNFLTRQSSYDFAIFYTHVQYIKYVRERGFPSWSGGLPILEEKVRMLALKAFEGDLVSKIDYQELRSQKNDLEIKYAEKDNELEEAKRQLECATSENKILEAIKLSFEGAIFNIGELRNWVVQIYYDEIEKRTNEKFNILAAGTSGILDFISNKISNKEKT